MMGQGFKKIGIGGKVYGEIMPRSLGENPCL
jgi:hypothetical protein